MAISNSDIQSRYRLRELIAHAKGGSPVALAGVIHFVRQELPLIAPQVVCSFAEEILEIGEGVSMTQRNSSELAHAAKKRQIPWPRNEQTGRSAASIALDESMHQGAEQRVPLWTR